MQFLLGLQYQRRLGFDICLRSGNASHLRITKWSKVFSLTVTTHVWLQFSPDNAWSLHDQEWSILQEQASQPVPTGSNCFVYHIHALGSLRDRLAGNRAPNSRRLPAPEFLHLSHIDRLHRALKHP